MVKGCYVDANGNSFEIHNLDRKTKTNNMRNVNVDREVSCSFMDIINDNFNRKKYEHDKKECLENKKIQRENEVKGFKYLLFQKIFGFLIIVLTILLCNSGMLYDNTIGGNDWTISLLFIPMGLALIFGKKNYIQ